MAEKTKADTKVTPEEFVTKWPLYTPIDVDGAFQPQDNISFRCGNCRKETTWALAGSPSPHRNGSSGAFYSVQYTCHLCKGQTVVIMYRYSQHRTEATPNIPNGTSYKYIPTKMQKIGQYPPLSIEIPAALEKNLGEEAANLYKKALINRNQGYGLGAVTYIRRVVEDKTDELIEVVAKLAEAHNVEADTIAKIRAAKTAKDTYDNKLKIAAMVLPTALVIDGVNPLGTLYSLVSEGVHELTEEQCIEVADETKSVFEFTFTQLRAETETRKDFVTKIKELAGGKRKTMQTEKEV